MRLRPLDIAPNWTAGLQGIEVTLDEILDDLLYPVPRAEAAASARAQRDSGGAR